MLLSVAVCEIERLSLLFESLLLVFMGVLQGVLGQYLSKLSGIEWDCMISRGMFCKFNMARKIADIS